jgi:flagellar protein FliL
MLKKLLPVVLGLLGLGLGGGAGIALRPAAETAAEAAGANSEHGAAPAEHGTAPAPEVAPEYVKLSNQFVVPVLEDGQVSAMVMLAISIEVAPGGSDQVYAKEPKLRGAFLQVLFDHANAGGFNGDFTDSANLTFLRRALLETAQTILGDGISDVLISDLARQDS